MGSLAILAAKSGYEVSGQDTKVYPPMSDQLREQGIDIIEGYEVADMPDAVDIVVIGNVMTRGMPVVEHVLNEKLSFMSGPEFLSKYILREQHVLVVSGTHGKTTTTSLVSSLLDAAGFDPTVINGGIINAHGTNAYLGQGDWMVVEADESDGTFIKLPSTVAVVTNIDPEHLDHYGDFDTLRDAFRSFVEQVPFYGFAVLCIDHPEVQALLGRVRDRRVVTYGLSPQADVRVVDLDFIDGRSVFSVELSDRVKGDARRIDGLALPMPGEHNVLNSAAAITVAREMGVPDDKIVEGLSRFGGVKRRFTLTGTWNGVAIYDDYGHHPVEISAVLAAARSAAKGRIIAVVQPHRYTRLRDLFEEFCTCFNDADLVVVADVYPAGEQPLDGYSAATLTQGLIDHGHKNARQLPSPDDLAALVAAEARDGDMVVFLGAGNITQWANALPGELEGGEGSA